MIYAVYRIIGEFIEYVFIDSNKQYYDSSVVNIKDSSSTKKFRAYISIQKNLPYTQNYTLNLIDGFNMSDSLPYVAIIDDSPSQLACIEVILKKSCNVITFKHVDDFLSHEDLDVYDLIITDYIMPDKNGLFVLEACKDYKTPIIVMTGSDDLEIEKQCLLAGAIDFIRKPFSPESFSHRILLNLTFIEQKNQIINTQEHLIANEKMAALGNLLPVLPMK